MIEAEDILRSSVFDDDQSIPEYDVDADPDDAAEPAKAEAT
jgi:hypothetical protein